MTSYPENEILTVEQFAERLQVSRTTVFGWMKSGRLREGIDYIHIGRILRFRWPFFPSVEPPPQIEVKAECKPPASVRPPRKRLRGSAAAINIDY
jgi:hypothetical protein